MCTLLFMINGFFGSIIGWIFAAGPASSDLLGLLVGVGCLVMLMGFPVFLVLRGSRGLGAEYRRFFLICGLVAGPLSTAMWVRVTRGMPLLATATGVLAGNLTIALLVLLRGHLAAKRNGPNQSD